MQRAFWNISQTLNSRNGIFCVSIFVALFLFYLFFQNKEADFIDLKVSEEHYSTGELANVALQHYQNGQALEALKIAYLYYSKLPLQKTAQRLASSIRLKLGLNPKLPVFFFWPLQFQHLWRYTSMLIFAAISFYFIKKHGKKNVEKYQRHTKDFFYMLRSYRNYFLCTILFLLSLSIPLRLHLAMNIAPKLQLNAIPQLSRTKNLADTETAPKTNWNNSLEHGELVKIKGQTNGKKNGQDDKSSLFSYLVVGEKQDQGWIAAQNLFIFP